MNPPSSKHGDADVVDRYFVGDRRLYEAYAALCRAQFRVDLASGDAACEAGDLRALERLGHTLKTVLQSLGRESLSANASHLELEAHADRADSSVAGWNAMRAGLHELIEILPAGGGLPR